MGLAEAPDLGLAAVVGCCWLHFGCASRRVRSVDFVRNRAFSVEFGHKLPFFVVFWGFSALAQQ
jgi:hypothetical protein